MKISFEGPAVFVSDMAVSRQFYEDVLGQKVQADDGPHVLYEGGFSLWQADHAVEIIHEGRGSLPERLGQENYELYFECAELDACWERVDASWDAAIHPVRVHPWGQRGFRVYDPDGHIVEVAEPLPLVVKRMLGEGVSAEEVSKQTGFPLDYVQAVERGEA